MPAESDWDRKLNIKIGTIKRVVKEVQMYEAEAQKQREVITKLENAHACPHDIRKQQEVLSETEKIIPECTGRLEDAKVDLAKFIKAPDAAFSPAFLAEAQSLIQ